MRELFAATQNENPMAAARRGAGPALPRRFYRAVTTALVAEGHAVRLDERPVRTPARHVLAAPTLQLAQALAVEWAAQREVIDPLRMPLTRLANVIIDGVAAQPAPVAAEIAKYLSSDLLFYRAASPRGLVERQRHHWDPILAWAAAALGARFVHTEGVIYVAQPQTALQAAGDAIPGDSWRLGALHAATTLTGSALIALALADGSLAVEDAWAAANVDEDWNMEQWGRDELALERRGFRQAEFQAAAIILRSPPALGAARA
jgi:chaperone required for assembly of F1-ATPase